MFSSIRPEEEARLRQQMLLLLQHHLGDD